VGAAQDPTSEALQVTVGVVKMVCGRVGGKIEDCSMWSVLSQIAMHDDLL